METFLDQILESTRSRVAGARKHRSFNDLDREAGHHPSPKDFVAAVRAPAGIALIAEIKRRSPSAGPIDIDLDAAGLGAAYREGGASALSVLTEPEFFGGSFEDLASARRSSELPVLRKDFLIDLYQIPEARVAGADAVLLIIAALADTGLYRELAAAAAEYRMAALVEVHDMYELESAFLVEPTLVGVNQRNLRTFEVDRGLAAKLRPEIPSEVTVVAESGIGSRADVIELENAGLDAMLVGESLVRSGDPAAAARALLAVDEGEAEMNGREAR